MSAAHRRGKSEGPRADALRPLRRGLPHLRGARLHQRPGRGDPASGYAYLVYPHRPLVAYETATGRLLTEYCVRFEDAGERLPDADDVLAKWIAVSGGERELIATANVDPPGHQIDPAHVRRDLDRLRAWRAASIAA